MARVLSSTTFGEHSRFALVVTEGKDSSGRPWKTFEVFDAERPDEAGKPTQIRCRTTEAAALEGLEGADTIARPKRNGRDGRTLDAGLKLR